MNISSNRDRSVPSIVHIFLSGVIICAALSIPADALSQQIKPRRGPTMQMGTYTLAGQPAPPNEVISVNRKEYDDLRAAAVEAATRIKQLSARVFELGAENAKLKSDIADLQARLKGNDGG